MAIGREHEDDIDTGVHLTLPPPAGPLPNPSRRRPAAQARAAAKPVFTRGASAARLGRRRLARAGPGRRRSSASAGSVDVVGVESRLSTGLARPDLYNWYTRFKQVIATMKPQVVVLSFGADDAHDYMAGVPGGKTVGAFGTPSWIAEYRRRVDGVTREFNAAGIRTVWLGLPIPDGPGFRHSFPIVNSILASVADAARAESRSTSTRGTCSTARTASTRRTCACTAS